VVRALREGANSRRRAAVAAADCGSVGQLSLRICPDHIVAIQRERSTGVGGSQDAGLGVGPENLAECVADFAHRGVGANGFQDIGQRVFRTLRRATQRV
jgi:hypothetical protein